jgi:hypothetical protein
MKNKRALILIIICLIGFGSIGLFIGYQYWTFDERKIAEYIGIDNYKLTKVINNHHQWYVNIKIEKEDLKTVLKRHDFKHGILDMRGTLPNDFIHFSPNDWYYIDKQTHGSYGYLVIHIKSDSTQVEMYELFND